MAFIQMNIMSQCLMRTVQVNVILPVDKFDSDNSNSSVKKFKTLYLLHGILGSQVDWINNTMLLRYAEEKNLAVVMPAGDNAFYLDHPKSHNFYSEFIGKELVNLTRKIFPLSDKREDTFLGGLSMGGYGAMRNGLKYADTFSRIISLSGAFNIDDIDKRTNDVNNWIESKDYLESCFGDLTKVLNSDKNPKWLIKKLLEEKKNIPEIFMACGTGDHLFADNNRMAKFLEDNTVKHVYLTDEGAHEWNFWDKYIKKAIEWLPLEDASEGIHSGNIGI